MSDPDWLKNVRTPVTEIPKEFRVEVKRKDGSVYMYDIRYYAQTAQRLLALHICPNDGRKMVKVSGSKFLNKLGIETLLWKCPEDGFVLSE